MRSGLKTDFGLSLETVARHTLVSQGRYTDGSDIVRMLEVDSREVREGGGFFALSGRQRDGSQFVREALERGARALFLSREEHYKEWLPLLEGSGCRLGVFFTPHPRRALSALSAELFDNPSHKLNLLGVVGTNGKTSITQFISQMLHSMDIPCGVAGTLGMSGGTDATESYPQPVHSPHLTTPENPHLQSFLATLVSEGVPYAAIEVSSIGWTQHRCDGLNFEALAFTNLGRDHLDWHGSLEAYQEAKFSPFLATSAKAVVNISHQAGQQLMLKLEQKKRQVLSWGSSKAALFIEKNPRSPAQQQEGWLCFEGQREPFSFPLPGYFQLENFLASVGMLLVMEQPLAKIAATAEYCQTIPGRMQRIISQPFEVLVDYAHTPEALKTLLRDTRSLLAPNGRLRLLFGCGGNRDQEKRPLMGEAASQADDIVLTSDNPRNEDPMSIIKQIAQGLKSQAAEQISNRQEAIRQILKRAVPGDVVLIVGKGHETYQEINDQFHPFSDVLIAQQFLSTSQKKE